MGNTQQKNQAEEENEGMPWTAGELVPCVLDGESIDGKFQFSVSDELRVIEAGQAHTVLVEHPKTHQRGFVEWYHLAGAWKAERHRRSKPRRQPTIDELDMLLQELDAGYIDAAPSAPVQDLDDMEAAAPPQPIASKQQQYLLPSAAYSDYPNGRCRAAAMIRNATDSSPSLHSASSPSPSEASYDLTESDRDIEDDDVDDNTFTLQ